MAASQIQSSSRHDTVELRNLEGGQQSPDCWTGPRATSPLSKVDEAIASHNGSHTTTMMEHTVSGSNQHPGQEGNQGEAVSNRLPAQERPTRSSTFSSGRSNRSAKSVVNEVLSAASFGVSQTLQNCALDHLKNANVSLDAAEAAAGVHQHTTPHKAVASKSKQRRSAEGHASTVRQEGRPRSDSSNEPEHATSLGQAHGNSVQAPGSPTPSGAIQNAVPGPDADSVNLADKAWMSFVDDLAHEIKILNVVSALLIP